MRTMAAGKFKAQCLGVIDEVQAKRVPVVLTKHGKPVAKLVPLDLADEQDPLDRFLFSGKIEMVGDIMAPIYTDQEYEEFYKDKIERMK